ncbi:MAG TPA: SusC/RagA family TonB-linked outer membrane protein, partial [Flavihumibacter sp.]
MCNSCVKKIVATATLMLCMVLSIWAQQRTLKGRILSAADGSPIAGASVTVKGSSVGTSTDADGNFTIQLPAASGRLIVTSIGFGEKEVVVNSGDNNIIIRFDVKASEAEEVVVVGYGKKSKANLTGSVVKVGSEQIKNVPMASPDQLLQGKAAGVQISSQSGTPGGGVTVRVRGTSSFSAGSPASQPLYIIDGVFVNTTPLGPAGYGTEQQIANPLGDLNPSDIESIEVLKDANSTAIYGSRGANGVVIITTKRGTNSQKPKITLNSYYGSSKATKLPELVNAQQTAELLNEAWINDGKDPNAIPYPNPSSLQTYNRVKDIFRTAPTYNVDLGVAGGDAKTAYYVGASYYKQDGIVRPQTFNRASFRLNLDTWLSDKFKLSTSNTIARNYRTIVQNDNSGGGVLLVGLGNSTIYPTYNPDGSYYRGPVGSNAIATIKESDETSTGVRYIGNIYGEWQIAKDLYF